MQKNMTLGWGRQTRFIVSSLCPYLGNVALFCPLNRQSREPSQMYASYLINLSKIRTYLD